MCTSVASSSQYITHHTLNVATVMQVGGTVSPLSAQFHRIFNKNVSNPSLDQFYFQLMYLDQDTFSLWFHLGHWAKNRSDRFIEHSLQSFLREGAALQILHSSDFLCHCKALGICNWC